MSELAPVSEIGSDEKSEQKHDHGAQAYTMKVYSYLVTSPVKVLQQAALSVNQLPAVAEGTEADLWFAAVDDLLVIDQSQEVAWKYAGGKSATSAIQKKMVVSRMRGSGLAQGSGSGQRHETTGKVDAGSLTADLWVTEMQSGCTVLILDWGKGQYSMVHLQPNEDEQFNWLGRQVMNLGGYTRKVTGEAFFKNVYKNAWLKQEMNQVVSSTGGAPQNYIMVQSMFEASRKKVTQLIGVRKGSRFTFYRQRVYARNYEAQELKWSGWWGYLPYFTY